MDEPELKEFVVEYFSRRTCKSEFEYVRARTEGEAKTIVLNECGGWTTTTMTVKRMD